MTIRKKDVAKYFVELLREWDASKASFYGKNETSRVRLMIIDFCVRFDVELELFEYPDTNAQEETPQEVYDSPRARIFEEIPTGGIPIYDPFTNTVIKEVKYKFTCRKCGYKWIARKPHDGKNPPAICPLCKRRDY